MNGEQAAEFRVVLVTCASREEAETIAEAVVHAGLAACVNVLPGLASFYMWEGAMQKESECLLVIKTRVQVLERLQSNITSLHSYTVPEFLVLPVAGGSHAYLSWLGENVPI